LTRFNLSLLRTIAHQFEQCYDRRTWGRTIFLVVWIELDEPAVVLQSFETGIATLWPWLFTVIHNPGAPLRAEPLLDAIRGELIGLC
jgi:hypothetical protein